MKCNICGLEKEDTRFQHIVFLSDRKESNWNVSMCADCRKKKEQEIWGKKQAEEDLDSIAYHQQRDEL